MKVERRSQRNYTAIALLLCVAFLSLTGANKAFGTSRLSPEMLAKFVQVNVDSSVSGTWLGLVTRTLHAEPFVADVSSNLLPPADVHTAAPKLELQGMTHKIYLPLIMTPPILSRYIRTANPDQARFYYSGYYSYTTQSGMVILDFGQPCSYWSGNILMYGARAFTYPGCRSTSIIAPAVKQFIDGYCDANGCGGYALRPKLLVAIGINNCSDGGDYCANPEQSTNVGGTAGEAWGIMVTDVENYIISRGYSYQVMAAGAMDIELPWNTPSHTREWIDGFRVYSDLPVYNFGTCDGCPTTYWPNPVLPLGWTYDDVQYVSWSAVNAYALPEIYRKDGTNANQWHGVAYYSIAVKQSLMAFSGALTQFQACQDTDPIACQTSGTDNTPYEGWPQLWSALYNDPNTRLPPSNYWVTDITWQQP